MIFKAGVFSDDADTLSAFMIDLIMDHSTLEVLLFIVDDWYMRR